MNNLTPYKKALELILSSTTRSTKIHSKSIYNLNDDVLAEDIYSFRDAPAYDNSAMDGYAINCHDDSKEFKIKDTIFAGDYDKYSISNGECSKVMTGAKIPDGANCVVPFENAISSTDTMATLPNISYGENYRTQASELKKGDILLTKGSTLNAIDIGILASNGTNTVSVYEKPTIAIISTGEEIIEPWDKCGEFGIYNSNSITIKYLLENAGFVSEYKGVFPDNLDSLIEFIDELKRYDFIISTGGVSMGEADFVKMAYEKNNMKSIFHKINLKPAKPVLFGKMENTIVFGLPGNPMSSALATLHFVLPSLRKQIGHNKTISTSITLKNKEKFQVSKFKANIVLGVSSNGIFKAVMNNKYNSGMLTPLKLANSMAIFDAHIDEVNEGANIKVVLFNDIGFSDTIDYMNE